MFVVVDDDNVVVFVVVLFHYKSLVKIGPIKKFPINIYMHLGTIIISARGPLSEVPHPRR